MLPSNRGYQSIRDKYIPRLLQDLGRLFDSFRGGGVAKVRAKNEKNKQSIIHAGTNYNEMRPSPIVPMNNDVSNGRKSTWERHSCDRNHKPEFFRYRGARGTSELS